MKLLILLVFIFNFTSQHLNRNVINKVKQLNFDNYDKPFQSKVKTEYFPQKLDHFDTIDKTNFYQFYSYNKEHYTNNQLVFLYIQGEGPMSTKWLEEGNIYELAKKHHALLVSLEHRFYGNSVPTGNLSDDALRYLSADQALEDLSRFKNHIDLLFNLKNPKYILFGGSYAGMLSSWARIKYPHLFYASVASSAPVKASLQFSSFEKVVGSSFANDAVGGSDKCSKNIKAAFEAINKDINSKKVYDYYQKLQVCDKPDDKNDWITFLDNVRSIYDSASQYNVKGKQINVHNICNMAGNFINPIDSIISVINYYLSVSGEECMISKYNAFLDQLKDESAENNNRAWFYQTCTEFGFYQDCDKNQGCIFSDMDTINFQLDACPVFGVNNHMVNGYIGHTNYKFGSNRPDGSRIVYINGGIDPWSPLGVYDEDQTREQYTLFTDDGSHCQEMHRARDDDSDSLKITRQKLEKIIDGWVNNRQ